MNNKKWFNGLKYAEECIKNNGLEGAEILLEICTDLSSLMGDYNEFDRGIQDCIAHYRRLSNEHL